MTDALIILWLAFPQLPVPESVPAPFAAALVRVACDLDLSTPNEGWRSAHFRSDLDWTRHAWHNLREAPPSADALFLPPMFVIEHALAANAAYHAHVLARQEVERRHWWHWESVATQTAALAQTWATLRQCHGAPSVMSRRWALARLREELGPAYPAGPYPVPVPLDRFERR